MVDKPDTENEGDAYDDDFEEQASVSSAGNVENNEQENNEQGYNESFEQEESSLQSTNFEIGTCKTQSKSKRNKRKLYVHLPASTSISPQPMASRVIDAKMWEQRRAQELERIANVKSTLMQNLTPPKPTPIGWRYFHQLITL
jgi:hypothetical protein